MSIPTLQQLQEQLVRSIRQHENKSHAHLALAAQDRKALIEIGRKLMMAKKSTLKRAQDDYTTFVGYMQQ